MITKKTDILTERHQDNAPSTPAQKTTEAMKRIEFRVRPGRNSLVEPFWGELLVPHGQDCSLGSDGHWDRWGTARAGNGQLDDRSVNTYTINTSSILYFQRKTTGSALISSKH